MSWSIRPLALTDAREQILWWELRPSPPVLLHLLLPCSHLLCWLKLLHRGTVVSCSDSSWCFHLQCGEPEWQSPATSFPAQGMVVFCRVLRKTQPNITTSVSFYLHFHLAFQNTVRMRFSEHDFPFCRTGGRVWVRHLVINLCFSLFAFSLV